MVIQDPELPQGTLVSFVDSDGTEFFGEVAYVERSWASRRVCIKNTFGHYINVAFSQVSKVTEVPE